MTDILERLSMSYCDDCNISDCDKDTEYCKADIISAYEQGRADERARIIDMLKSKAWVKDEHAYLLYDSVLVPISLIIDEIEEELKEQK